MATATLAAEKKPIVKKSRAGTNGRGLLLSDGSHARGSRSALASPGTSHSSSTMPLPRARRFVGLAVRTNWTRRMRPMATHACEVARC